MKLQTEKTDFSTRFNSFVGKTGLLTGFLLFPFVFEKIFAMGALRSDEWDGLLIFCFTLLVLSVIIFIRRKNIHTTFSLILFAFLFLISVELIARLSVKIFAGSETIKSLREECNRTYTENIAYTGHPFLQFTGTPSIALKGNKALGNLKPFNNFGFVGKDFHYNKPVGVMRIACLGESTTEDGYPAFLESYLNRTLQNDSLRFEVMNFGHAYWTTNHSLVNFMLNVIDFNPDYIVIHHGWNEERVRHLSFSEFRGDYSHAYKVFEIPKVIDRYPIRLSIIYRMIKFQFDNNPSWTSLGDYIQVHKKEIDTNYSNLDELKPFQRNLENIITVSLSRNIKVVLTTLPHSTDPNTPLYFGHKSIDQCNDITKKIAAEFNDRILFADLDSLITGKHNEFFRDLGHVNDAGRTMKSEAIGKKIITDVNVVSTELCQ